MGLYEKKGTKFVTVSGGTFNVSRGKDKGYDSGHYFRGWLRGIRVQEKQYNGESIYFAVLEMEDEHSSYDMSVQLRGGLFTGLLRSIRNAPTFRDQLDMHATGKEVDGKLFTNIWVTQNGADLRWDPNDGIPPVGSTFVNGQRITDTAMRDAWVDAEIKKINERIRTENGTKDVSAPGPDYGAGAPAASGFEPGYDEPDDQGFGDDLPESGGNSSNAGTPPAAPGYDDNEDFLNSYGL